MKSRSCLLSRSPTQLTNRNVAQREEIMNDGFAGWKSRCPSLNRRLNRRLVTENQRYEIVNCLTKVEGVSDDNFRTSKPKSRPRCAEFLAYCNEVK
ncbi:hypothetical protein HanXRQr2_Chr09g0384661 [Helianthus annuus]|uniref:Uncharacterized protein n=1 Tax=Helianthus annuus TaxID=4232 RepID=A0A251TU92_HELAN|nr:hypothetical protein HanXRQr2_Chr09g0384661 [Helianthus annuus]KAJ0534019.1 hypothetical protein HanIR_Chr09g0415031 [Helianthus annuus]